MPVRQPTPGLISLTYLIYGLHFFSAVNGILTPAFVLTAFLTGWPSIIAVIISYIKRGDTVGTYLDSHFGWLIRTFWFALLWLLVSIAIALTFFGLPLAFFMLVITGIWVLYRIARGVLRLMAEQAMPMSAEL
jgi:uncharacterized membrane protein